jgi:glutamate dehydrogenase/leucine dehydrogenase
MSINIHMDQITVQGDLSTFYATTYGEQIKLYGSNADAACIMPGRVYKITLTTVPFIESISVNNGPPAGGTPVTITGYGFTGATAVNFGTVSATSVVVVSDTRITCNSPEGSVGMIGISVVTPVGTSTGWHVDHFTYNAPPVVTSLTPHMGSSGGGTLVAINGTGFTGATDVKFGDTSADSLTVVSDVLTMCSSPAGSDIVDVTVITPNGTSNTSLADRFTYV